MDGTEGFSTEQAATDELELGKLSLSGIGGIAIDANAQRITEVADPSSDQDAATKNYVDNVAAGLNPKDSVRVRAQGNIVVSGPGANIDGVAMNVDDRVLMDQQTTTTQDGIYLWKGAAVAMVRSDDAQTGESFAGVHVFIEEGTDADSGYVCSNDQGADIVGTHDLVFVQFTGLGQVTAGTGLTKTGNTINAIGGDGIVANANDLAVDLATDPGLEFATAQLRVLVAPNGGIERVAAGIGIKLDGTTLQTSASGASVKGLPSLFEINAVAVGATVTAANLDTLTDTSNADALHTHASVPATEAPIVEEDLVAVENVAIGDPVAWSSTANKFAKGDASNNPDSRVFGIARTAILADASGPIVRLGIAVGVLSSATPNTTYYLASAGGLTTTRPTAGARVIRMGWAKNADDLEVSIHDFGKSAA
jgi:hypothetical protein